MSSAAGAPGSPQDGLCLITGASGFIGGRLAERMVEEGLRPRCLARASSDTSRLQRLGVEIARGDLTVPASLRAAVAGCRYVVHCGAIVSDWATTGELRAANVAGTASLLEACVESSLECFVHISTTDVYGYPGGRQVDEDHPWGRFRNWYSETKREAELALGRGRPDGAPHVVILRPATVYGPGSVEVVGEIARALRARRMLLVGGGRPIAGLCYVENLIDAILLALTAERRRQAAARVARGAPAAAPEALNVSDGLAVTWREFVSDLAAGLGCPPARLSIPYGAACALGASLELSYRGLRRATGLRLGPLLSRQAVHVLGVDQDFSNRRARELLGWEPRVSYETGMRETLAWLAPQAPAAC